MSVAIPTKEWFVQLLRDENGGRRPTESAVAKRMRAYQEAADARQDEADEALLLDGWGI